MVEEKSEMVFDSVERSIYDIQEMIYDDKVWE